jgi:hypothetical protein
VPSRRLRDGENYGNENGEGAILEDVIIEGISAGDRRAVRGVYRAGSNE